MQSRAKTAEQYIAELPDERREVIGKLRQTILDQLPEGFEECMNYGMIGYVVPHSVYPEGYHCDPSQPLPFLNIASQKNHIAFYHMGLYSNEALKNWFLEEYPKHAGAKPDMGKSCIRFKNPKKVPYELLGELVSKVSVEDYINTYETVIKQHRKKK